MNTVNLPVSDIGDVELPSDFVDDVALSLRAGGMLQPLPHKSNLNPIRVHNATTGAFTTQPSSQNVDINNSTYFGSYSWSWFWNVDSYGGFTGRFFGANGGTSRPKWPATNLRWIDAERMPRPARPMPPSFFVWSMRLP